MTEREKESALAEWKNSFEDYKEFVVPIERKLQQPDGSWKSVIKDYMTVAGRLKMFWDENLEKGVKGSIETRKTLDTETEVEFVAIVTGARGTATGTAREQKIAGETIKFNVETCETSAVGRALGNLGYGLIGGVASADDVARLPGAQVRAEIDTEGTQPAQPQQQSAQQHKHFQIRDPDAPITPPQRKLIAAKRKLNAEIAEYVGDYIAKCGKQHLNELTKGEASNLIDDIRLLEKGG